MKKIIILFVWILATATTFAQQDAQYTQYMYNTININPAYAGSRGVFSIFGLHRTQWVGLDGAPVTNAVSINSPINGTNIGMGLSFVNDRIGPTDENAISADISYTVKTSETFKLSFGIKATANLFNLDINKLNPADQGDPRFQDLNNNFTPNIGAGAYLHSDKMYLGLSVPNFFETHRYDDNSVSVNQERMNFYLIGGYVFDLSASIKFKPAFLVKAVNGAPLQTDLSGNFLFNDKLTLGVAWRWDAAVSAMAGFQVTDGLFIGYGYDLETTKLSNYNSGSHEVFLRFELFNKFNKVTSPRFF
ncbi:type IX secretion system PorP/SprF family membrane protein [Flavobacterium gossypii]|uniref:Type IX secretion system PorP/SprF family membrane protein n=2 Tax=Flavobacterium TaxID=237 RepID=A0A495M4E6_9FLAO|nr:MULTISPECIES: type IX secretion system membrane protein PorP/SprF [Flavobacterium]MBA9074399.1 type IX secretion system PorP/SprF family membrane protein [Flavobacterium gossypii]RKS19159.1 type IX secretion system PorP/SprF family membrane protein [Flavobacterium endophyticum]